MDLSNYYAEICKRPIINREQERLLFQKYKDPSSSEKERAVIKDTIIGANLRFAFKQAKTYSKNDPSIFPDLISAANEGLLVGFEKFNPEAGVRYLSYAGWWVVQRILDEMSNMRIVSLPKWKQQLSTRIVRAIENKESITLPELKEMFLKHGISEKDVEELYHTRYLTYYIDDLEEGNFEVDPIQHELEKRMDNDKVLLAVASLESPMREIIARSFGFEDGIEQSPAKISKQLKLPKEEVVKLKTEGLDILKTKLASNP